MTNPLTSTQPAEKIPVDSDHLVRRARNGSRTAFHQLMATFHHPIYRMVFYRVRSSMDAEDLTQDIFLKAFQGMERLQSDSHFKSWLYRIALNCVRDYFRKKRWTALFSSLESFSGPEEPSGDEWIASNAPGPEEKLLQKEFWRQVDLSLQPLSVNEREAFVLRFYDQLDVAEIARVMKKNENTVKTHLYRAIKKVKNNPNPSMGRKEKGPHGR
jgi:RNA polymerase sigma-70 factor, ECF subfamily